MKLSKMKLSKTSWLVLTIGIFVIIFAGLGVARFQQFRQKNQLLGEIALAEQVLDRFQLEQLSSQKTELERQLTQTTSQFEAVKAIFSQPIKSVAASNILFDLAESYDLEVTEMSSLDTTDHSLDGIDCSAISLTAKVEGDVTNLVGFIVELNGQLATDVIRSITMTFPEVGSGEKTSADIHLVIYTYQGD